MGSSYQPELWRDLFVTLGTSAAALIGLLFVAASVRINEAKNRPVFRLRVRNVTIHLVAIFVQAMAVLTPQPMSLLGAEVMAISLCGLWLPISFFYQVVTKYKAEARQQGFSIYRASHVTAGYLLGIAGGAALVNFLNLGMYIITISYVVLLVFVISSAYEFMLGAEYSEGPTKAT